jgi:hypothetical protein
LKASAIALEIGSTVEEPDTMIDPLAPAGACDSGAVDWAVVGAAAEGAVDGAVLAPPLEQALRTSTAPRASAPRRVELVVVTSMIPPWSCRATSARGPCGSRGRRSTPCLTALTVESRHQRVFAGSLAFG